MFFTNYGSRKGREIAANPRVALIFPWVPAERQVIVTGTAAERWPGRSRPPTWQSRPAESRLGARRPARSRPWSRPGPSWRRRSTRSPPTDPDGVPLPDSWGGFRVAPDSVEFWQGRPARLHDRLRYRLADGTWVVERLAP